MNLFKLFIAITTELSGGRLTCLTVIKSSAQRNTDKVIKSPTAARPLERLVS